MRAGYAILLNLAGRTAVIVGGGGVAVRKARGLLAAGIGAVRCVAPSLHADLPGEVVGIAEAFQPRHLDGADLVFAATDRADVNDAVVREAHVRGLWVNRVDSGDEEGDFTVPAVWCEGQLTVAVSAAGSPALAAAVRDAIAAAVDPAMVRMVEVAGRWREKIMSAGVSPPVRQAVFRWLASAEALAVFRQQSEAGLRTAASTRWAEVGELRFEM